MNRIIISLLAVFAIFMNVNAQVQEGRVSYAAEFSSKKPEFQMYAGMMQGSKLDVYFSKGKSRSEMKVGTMMETVSITDNETEKMLTLMSGIIGKKAIEGTIRKDESVPAPKFTVELVNETKDIVGYKCKKAIVTDEQGSKYNFWYTEEIKINAKGQKYFEQYQIPGFPMEMEFIQNEMNVKMVATAVEKSLPKKHNLFSLEIPEGYQLTTQEEFEKMVGGMK